MASGRSSTSTVRYFEEDRSGTPCYREAVWGLVGMHLIMFTPSAPWVIWSFSNSSRQYLAPDGKPTEDANGALIPNPTQVTQTPTSSALSSDPLQIAPKVTASGPYCTMTGARPYFRENPKLGTLPASGNICVNRRWHATARHHHRQCRGASRDQCLSRQERRDVALALLQACERAGDARRLHRDEQPTLQHDGVLLHGEFCHRDGLLWANPPAISSTARRRMS